MRTHLFPARLFLPQKLQPKIFGLTIWRYTMKNDAAKVTTSYKEVRIGNTIYRVTSVFTGEKDLGKSLEQLAIRRAMSELASAPAH
jgi:hypothetical protein